MKRMTSRVGSLLLLTVLSGMSTFAQNTDAQADKPQQVVEELLNLEFSGGILQPAGWRKASDLFLRANSLSETRQTVVISSNYELKEIGLSKNLTKVDFNVTELGMIEPNLEWRTPKSGVVKRVSSYQLVLSSGDPKGVAVNRAMRNSAQSRTWRIYDEFPIPVRWFTKATAIRYVIEIREKSNDPTVKANADKTLAILEKLPE